MFSSRLVLSNVNHLGTWVSLRDVSKLSSLYDLLQSVRSNISYLKSRNELPSDEPLHPYPSHLILDARIQLSNSKRFCGWYVRFPSLKIAEVFVQYRKSRLKNVLEAVSSFSNKTMYNQYSVSVLGLNEIKNSVSESVDLKINDSVIRIDNASPNTTVNEISFLLRKWELSTTIKRPIVPLRDLVRYPSKYNSFLIYMEDAANARSILRELQLCNVLQSELIFIQYPQQLIYDED